MGRMGRAALWMGSRGRKYEKIVKSKGGINYRTRKTGKYTSADVVRSTGYKRMAGTGVGGIGLMSMGGGSGSSGRVGRPPSHSSGGNMMR